MTEDLTEALEIDRSLTELERTIDPLLNVTPVNASEAWADFQRSGFSAVPTLRSRPLSFEPDAIKRRLYNLEIERVEDPALRGLFLSKRDEVMRQITLLEDRDTSRFVYESLQIYGEPSEALVVDADELLAKIEIPTPRSGSVTAGASPRPRNVSSTTTAPVTRASIPSWRCARTSQTSWCPTAGF